MDKFPAAVLLMLLLVGCRSAPGRPSAAATWTEPETGMVFIEVKPGQFVMGSPLGEPFREDQERQHQVTLSHAFWLGAFEVTQHEWEVVMGTNPSWFREGGRLPIENVTWFEVQDFLRRLTARAKGSRFRLPSEAEWEYACRASTTTAYSTGTVLRAADANTAGSVDALTIGRGRTMRVGVYPANPWGFHDLHGNVWEWTQDEHCPYGGDSVMDPLAVCGSSLKVIRGGSWYFGRDSARCGLRYTHRPQDRGFSLGVRVVREADMSEGRAR